MQRVGVESVIEPYASNRGVGFAALLDELGLERFEVEAAF